MAIKRYILKRDFKAPYVRVTGNPRMPTKLCGVQYRRHDIVVGELKHANDKPAVVLVTKDDAQVPIPISMLSEVTEKEIGASEDSSSASGEGSEKNKIKAAIISTNPKVQYLDASLMGALAGLGIVWALEKKGIIVSPDKKNKIYGSIAGALLGAYLVFRFKNRKLTKKE